MIETIDFSKYPVGTVLGYIPLVVTVVDKDDPCMPLKVGFNDTDIGWWVSREDFVNLLGLLDPVKRQDRLKREIAEKQKELENIIKQVEGEL